MANFWETPEAIERQQWWIAGSYTVIEELPESYYDRLGRPKNVHRLIEYPDGTREVLVSHMDYFDTDDSDADVAMAIAKRLADG